MVGSQESNPRRDLTPRRLVALLALLALIATACGGSADNAASVDAATDADSPQPVADDLGVADSDATTSPDGAAPNAQVLAFAIQASEELSYSFEQGVSMDINLGAINLAIDPEDAFVTGEIDGDNSRVNADIGSFLNSMFGSLGLDLGAQASEFDGLEMDVWVVDDTTVIDMSSFVTGVGGLDPTGAADLAMFADGAVAVNLSELATLSGVDDADAAALVQQFGQGAQITDPAVVLEALRTVDALDDVGSDTFDGVDVTVYEATVAMDEYLEALDLDVDDQLGGLDAFDLSANSADAEALQDTLEAIEGLTVDLTILLDGEGLVRRLESTVDMGAVLAAGAGSADTGDAGIGGAFDLSQIDLVVETWQNFDDYGVDIEITPPDAPDRTAEVAALLESAN